MRWGQPNSICRVTLPTLSSIGAGVLHSWQRLWLAREKVRPLACVQLVAATLAGESELFLLIFS